MAVISMGYADGYLRTGSGKAQVLLGGVKAPVLGRICMDMCMVRIPEGVDVHRGDEVTVFGPEAGRQRTQQTRRHHLVRGAVRHQSARAALLSVIY